MLLLVSHQTKQTDWEESSQHIILYVNDWLSECISEYTLYICVYNCVGTFLSKQDFVLQKATKSHVTLSPFPFGNSKTALIYISILSMDQMTMCDVKRVVHSDELKKLLPNSADSLSSTEPFSQLLLKLLDYLELSFSFSTLINLLFSCENRTYFCFIVPFCPWRSRKDIHY